MLYNPLTLFPPRAIGRIGIVGSHITPSGRFGDQRWFDAMQQLLVSSSSNIIMKGLTTFCPMVQTFGEKLAELMVLKKAFDNVLHRFDIIVFEIKGYKID
jgi:hypothetical protein